MTIHLFVKNRRICSSGCHHRRRLRPRLRVLTHPVGHGIGMEGHEWPYLVKNNMFGWTCSLRAQPGMTFSNEPGIYIRGEFGVRLEDAMAITPDGAKLFTPQSESLERPF